MSNDLTYGDLSETLRALDVESLSLKHEGTLGWRAKVVHRGTGRMIEVSCGGFTPGQAITRVLDRLAGSLGESC